MHILVTRIYQDTISKTQEDTDTMRQKPKQKLYKN